MTSLRAAAAALIVGFASIGAVQAEPLSMNGARVTTVSASASDPQVAEYLVVNPRQGNMQQTVVSSARKPRIWVSMGF